MIMSNISDKLCITDSNDIYVYFEMIKSLKPGKILDMGMFLKRIGAISRQAMEKEINSGVELDAIDFAPEVQACIYETVYDEICTLSDFESLIGRQYDLSFLLHPEGFLNGPDEDLILDWLSSCSRRIFITLGSPEHTGYLLKKFPGIQAVRVDNYTYGLIIN